MNGKHRLARVDLWNASARVSDFEGRSPLGLDVETVPAANSRQIARITALQMIWAKKHTDGHPLAGVLLQALHVTRRQTAV